MTLVVAELGQNHLGDPSNLKKMIDDCIGISDIIKLQYWNVDNVYHKDDIRYADAKSRELDFNLILQMIDYVQSKNVIASLSFFGADNIEMQKIAELCTRTNFFLKFASSELDIAVKFLNNFSTIIRCPVVISLGYQNLFQNQVNDILKFFEKRSDLTMYVLSCVSQYPVSDAHKCAMNAWEDLYRFESYSHSNSIGSFKFGISDHTERGLENETIPAISMIERHFKPSDIVSDFRDFKCSFDKTDFKKYYDYFSSRIVSKFEIGSNDSDQILKDENEKRRKKT